MGGTNAHGGGKDKVAMGHAFIAIVTGQRKRRNAEVRRDKERERYLKSENLDSLALEALKNNKLISAQHDKGIRDSDRLEELYRESSEVEEALHRRIFAGEILKRGLNVGRSEINPFLLDYAFVNFYRNESCNVADREKPARHRYSESALFSALKIKSFIKDIGRYKGQMMLLTERFSTYAHPDRFELSSATKGKIEGNVDFDTHVMAQYHHKQLFIFLSELVSAVPDDPVWRSSKKSKDGKAFLEKGFFGGNSKSSDSLRINISKNLINYELPSGIRLSYADGPYFGGTTAFTRSDLYIGNKVVKNVSEEGLVFTETKKDVRLKI